MPLATALKAANPAAARSQPSAVLSAPPKRNGSGRTRFLIHCLGRAAAARAATEPSAGDPSAGTTSPDDVAAISLILND